MLRRGTVSRRPHGGFTMLEVLVSLLVFSFGVLGLIGLQGAAIRYGTDAQQRADATFLADQLLGRMLISDPSTMGTFAHQASGTIPCAPTGTAATSAVVTDWLAEVAAVLPNAASSKQQVVVDSTTGQVTVRLCWRNGPNDSTHQLAVSNQVQWQ